MKIPPLAAAALITLISACSAVAGSGDAAASELRISPAMQYELAESLYRSADPAAAAAEFKRFLFFFPGDIRAPRAALRIGQCLERLGRTEEAVAALERAAEDYPSSPVALEARFLVSDVYRRAGMPQQALIHLKNMAALVPAPGIQDQVRYRIAWVHIESGRWDDAADALENIGPVGREDLPVGDLRAELAGSADIQRKDPTIAGALSIVPGAGQLYCGRPRDAAIAFFLNAGLIWAAVEAFDNESYALGTVITVIEAGFYAGNIYSAVGSAHKYNRRSEAAFIDRLKLKFGVTPAPDAPRGSHRPAMGMTISLSF